MSFNTEHTAGLKKLGPLLGLLAALCLWLSPGQAGAQAAVDAEHELRAGFIYNFALFAAWPANSFATAAAPLIVCIAGGRDALGAFDPLKTKNIQGRPVTVRHCGETASGSPCHIIYIPTTNKAEAANLLKQVSGPGVLTIGDADGFSGLGGIIAFYRESNKLRFEINTDAAQRAGLKLSSQLLKLAKIVTDKDVRK